MIEFMRKGRAKVQQPIKPANVLGQPKSQTPKFDIKKKSMELFKIVPFLIFSENNPMQEIQIIDKYTKGMIE